MTSKYVLDLYLRLDNLGIKIWIDGGWAVDALIGKQTRPHKDLDIAIEHKNLPKFKGYLESQGYKEIDRDENKKWDLVLRDSKGHEIEAHAFTFDENGHVLEEKYWDGYSANSLSGKGVIDKHEVKCVSLDQLIKTHDGKKRKLSNNDYRDLVALCEKFGIEYPEEYAQPKK